jgi:hypothetical protein
VISRLLVGDVMLIPIIAVGT